MTPERLNAIVDQRQYGATLCTGEAHGCPWVLRTHPRDGHRLSVGVPRDLADGVERDDGDDANVSRHTIIGESRSTEGDGVWLVLTIIADADGARLAEDFVRDALGLRSR